MIADSDSDSDRRFLTPLEFAILIRCAIRIRQHLIRKSHRRHDWSKFVDRFDLSNWLRIVSINLNLLSPSEKVCPSGRKSVALKSLQVCPSGRKSLLFSAESRKSLLFSAESRKSLLFSAESRKSLSREQKKFALFSREQKKYVILLSRIKIEVSIECNFGMVYRLFQVGNSFTYLNFSYIL